MPIQESFSRRCVARDVYLDENQKQELIPEYLRPFLNWFKEYSKQIDLPLTVSGFTPEGTIHPDFTELILLQEVIRKENERRTKQGKCPVSIIGVHAAPKKEQASYRLLDKILSTLECLGISKHLSTLYDQDGKSNPEIVRRVVEEIRKSDGFIITTHTRRGIFSSLYTVLLEALEKEDLAGKLVGFIHTFTDPEKDSQVVPLQLMRRFFEEKRCLILPYSLMYAHKGKANEPWLERDIERNGVNFLHAIDRLSRSRLLNFLRDPSRVEQRKNNKKTSRAWKILQKRVKVINTERKKQGEQVLNVLFILGGENPTGYSSRAAQVLGKNLCFLGLQTNSIRLADADEQIIFTNGNPEVSIREAAPELQYIEASDSKDAVMQQAYRQLLYADIVIFASPVRWYDVSARLQRFIERTTPLEVSGYLLAGKAFGSIITFSEGGGAEAEARLQYFADSNGMMNIPMGGMKIRLGSNPKGKDNPQNKDFFNASRYKSIRRMAAMGTALITEFLVADGKNIKQLLFNHLNPLLSLAIPED